MLVAEKCYGGHANNLFDAVLNIMAVTNLKSVSMHATFPELGMDSMTAVEIQPPLLFRVKDLANTQQLAANTQQLAGKVFVGKKDDIPTEIKLLLSYMSKGELMTKPLTEMETSVEASDEAAPRLRHFWSRRDGSHVRTASQKIEGARHMFVVSHRC
ncbi:hypothetical protein QE152_g5966 [Popillia japonica]|uniref:Polyketide synthase n=1 Tax=Popillia japonica TaxID=7064 RepID=A0AAW1MIP1_POPJA